MSREQAITEIKSNPGFYLKQDGSKKGYICPCCGSGSGKNGTGMTSKDNVHFTCWSCGNIQNNDIIDIIGIESGLTEFNAKLNKACEVYGIDLADPAGGTYQNQKKNEQYTHNSIHTTDKVEEPETDYTAFFLEANRCIKHTDYPQKRGLSEAIIDRFNLGYAPSWKHHKAPDHAPESPRLIIPTSDFSYIARDTRPYLSPDQEQYKKMKTGEVHIFNEEALKTATRPIFITEGEIDALSIMEVGGEAIAMGSTSNINKLLSLLEAEKPAQPLIIALDNDEAGKKAADTLKKALEALTIDFCEVGIVGTHKDANEALIADREALKEAVIKAEWIAGETARKEKELYLQTSAANHLQSFINGIADSVNTPSISTGFNSLDYVLDGGLYEGLYIIGAISSLGKTTLITQIADQIAEAGTDILIFSLEMARTEIMAKSISRLTLLNVLQNGGDIQNAKTARGITTGKRWEGYNQTEKELITSSIRAYGEYAKRIFISEGIGDIGAAQIRTEVENHIKHTGNKPVIIVDYLQILAPYNERATDKQNTDKAVMELKRISRDFKIPVIGISSFNRDNYKNAVTMQAFKESGAIEYSSDVLIGLQLKGAGEKEFNEMEQKSKNPREVELVILKNRNGSAGNKISYEYYPLFNYFKE